jgi:hypothetical protein
MVARLTSFTKKTNRHGGSEYKLKHRTAKTRGGSIFSDKSVGDLITGRAVTGVEGA